VLTAADSRDRATLASVNVGMPADVDWNGRVVHTGSWKSPVAGPRTVRRLNIDGDGQGDLAGHGGENRAVLVYQLESYRHWARELGRDDLTPGVFGENLTVDGLPDSEVCIGDRYRIGDVVLEVTQPRVTCYRVGMRVREPRMAALLVAHRRPGFYCRVLAEGQIEAGQQIEQISQGPEAVTVADIDGLLYLPGHPRDSLERALRIPALSPGWKGSLESLLAQSDSAVSGNSGLTGAATGPPAWPGFRALRVVAARAESRDVRSVTLADPDGTPLPPRLAGQSIAVRVPIGDTTAVRSYSLCNSPATYLYRIAVKRETHGSASNYVHDQLPVGAEIDIAAPRGDFVLDAAARPLVLLSAGVGVTPLLSMLHAVSEQRSDRPLWWIHAARNGVEHPFAAEASEALRLLPGSRSAVFYSRPRQSDRLGIDYDRSGRITAQALAELQIPSEASVFVCGPDLFMADVTRVLVDHGMRRDAIHVEVFAGRAAVTPGIAAASALPPHQPAGPTGDGPVVQFARSGISAPWGSGYASLLEFAEACDIPTRWSCRTGVCHTCETGLLAGRVRNDPGPLEEPAEGNCLPCIAAPATPVVLDL
jgi:ferredoxin-NADP reductase/MOSC domain-containing protein YiiM